MPSVMDGVNRLTQLAGQNKFELLMFRLGGRQRFGINVFKVREVIKCPPLTRVPHANPVVCGIANMRGQTITVMDLSAAIGGRSIDRSVETFVVVAEYNRRVLGFLVSSVDRIVNKNWADIKPPPTGIGHGNYLTAVTQVDNELVEIIDVEKVLSEVIGLQTQISQTMAAEVSSAAAEPAERPHVFVADDSAMARKQITRVLDQVGVTYEIAENGRQAWDMLLADIAKDSTPIEDRIAMVLSDVEMPEMDGYTLTKNIKEHPQLQKLFVCLHTSLSGNFNEAMIKRVGADKLVPKFDPDDLARMVLDHVNAVAARRQAA
jgi:two-component system chemotaxis response regulator CheV